MKLHTFHGSPNGRKVEAVIRHLKLDVEIVYHDFLAGDLRREDFQALNPNRKVPVLEDGAFVLWESNAIMHYLADRSDDVSLVPREPRRRADVLRWLFWEMGHFNKAFGTQAFEAVAKPKLGLGETDGPAVAQAQRDLAYYTPVLEQHLAGRRYVAGDELTIADFALVKLEAYRDGVPFDFAPYPLLNAYFDRLRTLDAWAATETQVRRAA